MRYLSTFFVCAALAVAAAVICSVEVMSPGEGSFGAAKAVPFVLLFVSTGILCLIWFPANLGVFIWQRHQRESAQHPAGSAPLILFSAVLFVLFGCYAVMIWIPAWHLGQVNQRYEALAGQPSVELKDVKEVIDSYCVDSGRGFDLQPRSGTYVAITKLIGNTATPPEVLNYLADHLDDNSQILFYLAQISNCPPRLITRFSSIPSVHTYLARNPAATPQLLDMLAYSTNWEVRVCVARNANAAQSTLEQLATDSDRLVREGADDNLKSKPDHH